MSEYIDYDEICKSEWVFCDEKGCNDCQYAYGNRGCNVSDWIDSLPRYEMSMKAVTQNQQRQQGEWVEAGYYPYYVCSDCGQQCGKQNNGVEIEPLFTKYCPNCGTKMGG